MYRVLQKKIGTHIKTVESSLGFCGNRSAIVYMPLCSSCYCAYFHRKRSSGWFESWVVSPFSPVKGSYQNRPRTTTFRSRMVASTLQSASLTDCNLTKDELHALKGLKSDKDIVILPADKGLLTVALDKKDYTDKMDSLLWQTDIWTAEAWPHTSTPTKTKRQTTWP